MKLPDDMENLQPLFGHDLYWQLRLRRPKALFTLSPNWQRPGCSCRLSTALAEVKTHGEYPRMIRSQQHVTQGRRTQPALRLALPLKAISPGMDLTAECLARKAQSVEFKGCRQPGPVPFDLPLRVESHPTRLSCRGARLAETGCNGASEGW